MGIAVPEGFILVRTARAPESAPSEQSQPSTVVEGGPQGSDHESATAGRSSWFDDSVNVGVSSSRSAPSASLESLLLVSFDNVPQVVEDDICLSSEKAYPSEGLRSALRLVF